MKKNSNHTQAARQKMRAHNKSRSADPIESFWRRVDKNGPVPAHVPGIGNCWEWTGATLYGKYPYGVLTAAGKEILAHRFAYALAHAEIPEGMCVLHHCDNPKCIRDAHLYLGTRVENNLDRDRKHRQAHGARNSHAKLTAQEVDTLKWSYTIGGVSQATLARWYGISDSSVSLIVHNKNWRQPQAA